MKFLKTPKFQTATALLLAILPFADVFSLSMIAIEEQRNCNTKCVFDLVIRFWDILVPNVPPRHTIVSLCAEATQHSRKWPDAVLGSPLYSPSCAIARWVSSATSRPPGSTGLRFALPWLAAPIPLSRHDAGDNVLTLSHTTALEKSTTFHQL